MPFLTKDVNKSLLVLLIFFLVLFIGFTVYSTSTLRKALGEKKVYDENLGKITAEIVMQRLNQTNSQKDIAMIDKLVLESKYNELLTQYGNLDKEKTALEGEVSTLKSQMEYQKVKVEGPVAQFRLIQDKNDQIMQLKAKIDALCSKLKENHIFDKDCN